MKTKKLLAIIAPAMLLASCGGNNNTTTISKINLTNAKTLIMGKLSNSSVTTNDDEEQLISVDEEGNATETEVEVTTGNKTTETTNITISRLVKLNKEYAVVSCTYNDVTYDLIVNLTDGTCVKFPDSSLLPNSKEKMGGHKAFRKYKKQYGYLNSSVVQPNSEEKFFYYINCYQIDETSNKYARRLVMLDLESDVNNPSAKALVTPVDDEGNKLSVQSFAVNNNGAVAYVTSNDIKITKTEELNDPKVFYNGEDCEISINSEYEKISPVLITGEDGVIYCYLKVKNISKYVAGSITLSESGAWIAEPIIEEGSSPTQFDSYPEKVFGVNSSSGTKLVTINNVSEKGTFNQLLSFGRKNFNTRSYLQNRHPGGKENPSDRETGKGSGPTKDVYIKDESSLALDNIIDGFTGNSFGYLFGSKSKFKGLRKIKYVDNESTYQYVEDILSKYLSNLTDDAVIEIESDDESEDIIVVVEDEDKETIYVVNEETEEPIEEITEVSDVVDVTA